jgi:hypoxanthine-guanine phosphoribosyltransferase
VTDVKAIAENLYERGKQGMKYVRRRIPAALRAAYADAFQVLVHVLTGVTVFAAMLWASLERVTMLLMMKMSLAQMYRNP